MSVHLGPGWLVVYDGEHALVAGPARSGKSSTLLALAETVRRSRPDVRTVVIAGPRSPLPGRDVFDHQLGPTELSTTLPPLVEPGVPTLLVVDDAESVDDRPQRAQRAR